MAAMLFQLQPYKVRRNMMAELAQRRATASFVISCLIILVHSKLEIGLFSVLVNFLDELPRRQVVQT